MATCLVTKLKGVSDNNNLPKMGEWIFSTKQQTITDATKQLQFYINAAAGTVVSADGVTFTPVTLDGRTNTPIDCPNGNYRIHISDKYSITLFSINSVNTPPAIFDVNLNDLGYALGLKTLRVVNTEKVTLDVSNLANLSVLETCVVFDSPGVFGDIAALAGISTLKNLSFKDTGVYGDISAINASANNLVTAYFENTGVTGDLANITSFKKDGATVYSYLLLENTKVTGTIESLAANIGPYRSGGYLVVGCAGTAITYQGNVVNRQIKITFNGTANPTIEFL